MPSEEINVGNLQNRIELLTKDCDDYRNKIKVMSDLLGELSYEFSNCRKHLVVLNKNNDRQFNLIIKLQDFYKENNRMSKKQFMELLKKYLL